MTMDVTLHIGAHRCATTTFQHFLTRNRVLLADAGIACWTPDRTRRGLFAGLVHRPDRIDPVTARRARRATGLIGVERDRLTAAGVATLLVSDENMMGSVRANLRAGALYPDLAARLARFAPAFADCRRIAVGIRAYDTYWASALAFAVAQGHRMPGTLQLDRLAAGGRGWRQVIGDVAVAFPLAEIVVWPFERVAARPEAQLAALSGTPVRVPPLSGAREWHNAGPRRAALRRILRLRGDDDAALAIPGGSGRWMPFDTDHRAELRARYSDDLDWLASGAGGSVRLLDAVPGDARADDARRDATKDIGYVPATIGRLIAGRTGEGHGNDGRDIMV